MWYPITSDHRFRYVFGLKHSLTFLWFHLQLRLDLKMTYIYTQTRDLCLQVCHTSQQMTNIAELYLMHTSYYRSKTLIIESKGNFGIYQSLLLTRVHFVESSFRHAQSLSLPLREIFVSF